MKERKTEESKDGRIDGETYGRNEEVKAEKSDGWG